MNKIKYGINITDGGKWYTDNSSKHHSNLSSVHNIVSLSWSVKTRFTSYCFYFHIDIEYTHLFCRSNLVIILLLIFFLINSQTWPIKVSSYWFVFFLYFTPIWKTKSLLFHILMNILNFRAFKHLQKKGDHVNIYIFINKLMKQDNTKPKSLHFTNISNSQTPVSGFLHK